MRYSCFLLYCAIAAVVQGALQDRPPCPRKRGLSEGLTWAQNKIHKRHLYKLKVKKAATGFIPDEKYRLRVHTTYLKRKFDDAQIFLEALDERCGAGTFILDDPKLFTPKGCPDIVATKTKEPMGRADVFWKAPKCGCVNIRVRVHSEGVYFLDDEDREEGPLAKRLCPKDKSLWSYPETKIWVTRKQKLDRLCNLTSQYNASEIAQSELFQLRRTVHQLTEFEQERLETALELRSEDIKSCCGMEESQSIECFGDVRRRRIDTFCGTGETDIPFTTSRVEWIKERKSACCWQIGEDRYHCFNHTLYQESMLRDGRIDESKMNDVSLDEFDPANDIDDYPADDQPEKTEIETTTFKLEETTDTVDGGSSPHTHSRTETGVEKDEAEHDDEEENKDSDDDESNSAESTIESEERDEYDGAEVERHEDDSSQIEGIDRDRVLTKEECCHNGIAAGTRVEEEGLIGCFRMAEKFASVFTNWTIRCDRRFVVCCMRVVDAQQLRLRHSKRRINLLTTFSKTLNDSNYHITLLNENNIIPETNLSLTLSNNTLGYFNESRIVSANEALFANKCNVEVYKGILILFILVGIVIWLFLLCRLIRLSHIQFCYTEL